jgi:hypothetical protein
MRFFGSSSRSESSPALPAGQDVNGRRVTSEPAASTVVDTRHAERGRGYLSGDGQTHPHTR